MAKVKPTRNKVNRVKPDYAEVERTPVSQPAQEEQPTETKKPGWWKRNRRKVFGIAGIIGGAAGALFLGKKIKEGCEQYDAGMKALTDRYPEGTVTMTDEDGNEFSCFRQAFYNGENNPSELCFWTEVDKPEE